METAKSNNKLHFNVKSEGEKQGFKEKIQINSLSPNFTYTNSKGEEKKSN